MTLQEITDAANAFCDESFSTTLTIHFANEGLSIINTRLNSTLPSINATTSYTALSDDWLRLLIIPYVSYSIKQNDGSISESDRFAEKFYRGLVSLESNKSVAIPEEYQGDNFDGITTIDTTKAINVGWFADDSDDFLW